MIKCGKSDFGFIEKAKSTFPQAEFIEEDSCTGEEWITIAIALTGLSIQIVDFVFTHLTKSTEGEQDKKRKCEKRVIITPDDEISLIGYSKNDVIKILEELR